jgi:hypothetical protein
MRNHRAAGLPLVTIAQPPWTKAMRGVAMGTGVSRRNDPGKKRLRKGSDIRIVRRNHHSLRAVTIDRGT